MVFNFLLHIKPFIVFWPVVYPSFIGFTLVIYLKLFFGNVNYVGPTLTIFPFSETNCPPALFDILVQCQINSLGNFEGM